MISEAEELVKSGLKQGWKFELLCEGEHLCKDNKNCTCRKTARKTIGQTL